MLTALTGGADSGTVVYSTTARTNVPWVCVAKAVSNQVAAGTWDAPATQIDMAPFTGFQAFERTFAATLTGVSGSVTSTATIPQRRPSSAQPHRLL